MALNELHILMLEDSPADAELLRRELARGGVRFTVTLVDTETAFERALVADAPDIILADYSLPSFTGMDALVIAQEVAPDVPFIFVSGSIGEDRAIEALRAGATDYLLKDRPSRLPSAVERAIAERESRRKRRRMEEALRVSEERFHYAVRATRDVIFDWDLSRDLVWTNEALRSEWGYSEETFEMPLSRWEDLIHPDDRETVRKTLQDTIDGGQSRFSMQFRLRRADGNYGHVLERGLLIRDNAGRPERAIGAIQDITERVLADSRIRALSMENEQILHYAAEGILGVDGRGAPTFANPAALKTLGRDATELFHLGSVHELAHHGASRGHTIDECPLTAPLSDRRVHSGEAQFWTKQKKLIEVEYTTSPIVDWAGDVNGCVVTFQDITERQELKHQLQISERISSLGRIAANIAHEFNNVLMGIQPFAEVIRRRGEGDEKVQRAAAQILQSVSRGRQITQEILRVANPGQTAPEAVDAGEWLRQVTAQLEPVVGARVRLIVHIERGPLYMRCDPAQMQQVVTNLVHNARDAMPRGGTVTLTARPAGEFVELTVADSGEGISEELLTRIFEPLFTTKRTGTGLGLAIARQLVVQNKGTIHVQSTPGTGTTFTLCLPRTEGLDEDAEIATPERSAIRRILIVDDEVAITTGMTALLESEGFEVRTVDRGLDAAAAIEEFDPEAVILDLTLPDIDGTDVYRMLAERRPDIPVIFASGHMDESFLREALGKHRVAFLRKPYDFEMLLGALEEIL